MSKDEFMRELMQQLMNLPEKDKEQVREYYDEMICDGIEQGRAEEETIAGFGPVDKIADKIKEEYGQLTRVETNKDRQADGEERMQDRYESKVIIHTIRIKAENTSIQIRPVQSGQARILFQPREGVDHVKCSEENGVFSFEHYMTPIFSWTMRSFHSTGPIVVEVPVNFDGLLWAKTVNASVKAEGLEHLSAAELYSSNGRIEVEAIQCENMVLKTGNARVGLTKVKGRTLDAGTSNGKITIDMSAFEKELKLTTTNGGIVTEKIASDHIELRSSNGSIKGTIMGSMNDYNINSHTSNASNNLPKSANQDREKTLSVRTSNAKIDLSFER